MKFLGTGGGHGGQCGSAKGLVPQPRCLESFVIGQEDHETKSLRRQEGKVVNVRVYVSLNL